MKRVSKEEYEKMSAVQRLTYARQLNPAPKPTQPDRFAKSQNSYDNLRRHANKPDVSPEVRTSINEALRRTGR